MKKFKKLIAFCSLTLLVLTSSSISVKAITKDNADELLNHQLEVFPKLRETFNSDEWELFSVEDSYYKFTELPTAKYKTYTEETVDDFIMSEISAEEFEKNDIDLTQYAMRSSDNPNYTGHINNSDPKLRLSLHVYRSAWDKSKFTAKLSFVWKTRPIFKFTDALAISPSSSLNVISGTSSSQYVVHSILTDASGQNHYIDDVYDNKLTVKSEGALAEVDILYYGESSYGHEGYLTTELQFNNPGIESTGGIYGEYIHAKLKGTFTIEDNKIKPGMPEIVNTRVNTDVSVHNRDEALPDARY